MNILLLVGIIIVLVINHIAVRATQVEIREIKKKLENLSTFSEDLGDDQLYQKAKEVILDTKKCSTSFLQRRLKIGYSRAVRLVDKLEEEGLIGPVIGTEPRKVLIIK